MTQPAARFSLMHQLVLQWVIAGRLRTGLHQQRRLLLMEMVWILKIQHRVLLWRQISHYQVMESRLNGSTMVLSGWWSNDIY